MPDIIPLRSIFYNYNVISINKYYFWFSTDTLVCENILGYTMLKVNIFLLIDITVCHITALLYHGSC